MDSIRKITETVFPFDEVGKQRYHVPQNINVHGGFPMVCDNIRAEDGCVLKVEVLSDHKQVFDGESFYRYGSHKYFTRPKRRPTPYLHRIVWMRHHGDIPKGYHVHHKDGDRTNNQIDNLELLTPKQHIRHHLEEDPEAWAAARAPGLELAREAARHWHKSEEGLAWHRRHGDSLIGKVPDRKVPCTCVQCGNEFMATRASVYCSKTCKTAARYHSGIDNVTRKCNWCQSEFQVNRYTTTAYCGKLCSARASARKRLAKKAV